MRDLFRIIVRRPIYAAALQHCEEVYRQLPPPAGDGPVGRAARGVLLYGLATDYRRIGRPDDEARLIAQAQAEAPWPRIGSGPGGAFHLCLQSSLDLTTFPDADNREVVAVTWAILLEWQRLPIYDAVPVMAAIAATTNSMSPSLLGAIAEYVECERPGSLAEAMETSWRRAQYQVVDGWQESWARTAMIAAWALLNLSPDNKRAEQVRRKAAEHFRGLPELGGSDLLGGRFHFDRMQWNGFDYSPDMRAAVDGYVLFDSLINEESPNEATLRRIVDQAHAAHVIRARSILTLESWYGSAQYFATKLHSEGKGSPDTAIRIAELAAECRAGALIRNESPSIEFEPLGTSYLDIPFGDTDNLDPAQLDIAHPDTVFAWINAVDVDDGTTVYYSCGRDSATGNQWAVRVKTASAQLPPELLPITRTRATRVVVIPNLRAWHLPWVHLVPDSVAEYLIAPSVGAIMRRGSRWDRQLRLGPPRVIGIFDETLPGARAELSTLLRLRSEQRIIFDRAFSYDDLGQKLAERRYDLLTIAVHGSSAAGAEYRLMLPSGTTAPAMVFGLALPPLVVLGSCWSAKVAENPDSIATPIGCLAMGADLVVGGLWAINDHAAGQVLSHTYERFANGEPFANAFRTSYLAAGPPTRDQAAGLSLIGLSRSAPRQAMFRFAQ